MNNNCIFRNYSEMYIQSQSLTVIGWLPVFYMLFMHNDSGLATRLSVSPPWYNPRPGVGAAGPTSTPIDCLPVTVWQCLMSDIAWLTSSFDKLSSLFISFIIIDKWFNSVMSRDRSATIRFSRRAENLKSFSIAISSQSNYFHSKILSTDNT